MSEKIIIISSILLIGFAQPLYSYLPLEEGVTSLPEIDAPPLIPSDLEPTTKQIQDWELFNEKESGRYRIEWSRETGSAYIIQNSPDKFILKNSLIKPQDRAKDFIESLGSIFEGRKGNTLKVIKVFEVPTEAEIKSLLSISGISFNQAQEDYFRYFLNKFYDAERFLLEKRDALLQKYTWKLNKLNNKYLSLQEKQNNIAETISEKAEYLINKYESEIEGLADREIEKLERELEREMNELKNEYDKELAELDSERESILSDIAEADNKYNLGMSEIAEMESKAFQEEILLEQDLMRFFDENYGTDFQVRFAGAPAGSFLIYLKDELGMSIGEFSRRALSVNYTVIVFQQYYSGVPVEGAIIKVRVSEGKEIDFVMGKFYRETAVNTNPSITSEEARDAAMNNLSSGGTIQLRGDIPPPELVILPYGKDFYLTYKVVIPAKTPLGDWYYFVDAHSGRILQRENRIKFYENGSGWVYDMNPIVTPSFTTVTIPYLDGSGYLKGDYFEVLNGVESDNQVLEERAHSDAPFFNFYYPPATVEIQGLSSFINEIPNMFGLLFNQVEVYYHLNRIFDYYRWNLYYNPIDPEQAPVRATANAITTLITNYKLGGLENAFFSPSSITWPYGTIPPAFAFGLGAIPGNNGCWSPFWAWWVFTDCSGLRDLNRESHVIYHEFQHLVFHRTQVGLGHGAVNEACSDYFAASYTNDPYIGRWVFADIPPYYMRVVQNNFRSPEARAYISTEEHNWGQIFSGSLWDFRNELLEMNLSSQTADQFILNSLQISTLNNFTDGVVALKASISAIAPELRNKAEIGFARHGVFETGNAAIINALSDTLQLPIRFEILTGDNLRNDTVEPIDPWPAIDLNNYYIVELTTDKNLFLSANANQRNSSNYYSSPEQLVRTWDMGHAFYTVPTENITQFGLPFNIYYRVKTYDKVIRSWIQWITFCFRFLCFRIPILRTTNEIDGSSIRYSINDSEVNYTPFIKIWRFGPIGCPGCTGQCGIARISYYTKINFIGTVILLLGLYISARILIKYNMLK